MTTNSIKPSIYVACLAAYNSGYLHGRWIDASLGENHIWNEVKAMLAESPISDAEEWAIHDFEGFPNSSIGEYTGFTQVSKLAEFITEYGAVGVGVLDYYEVDQAIEVMEDHYHGEWDSELDYAIELFDEIYLHTVPESASAYIDYEKFAYDLFMYDYFSVEVDGSTHVFSNY